MACWWGLQPELVAVQQPGSSSSSLNGQQPDVVRQVRDIEPFPNQGEEGVLSQQILRALETDVCLFQDLCVRQSLVAEEGQPEEPREPYNSVNRNLSFTNQLPSDTNYEKL